MSVVLLQIACLHITWRFYKEEDSDLVAWGRPCLFSKLPRIHFAGLGTILWPGLRGGASQLLKAPVTTEYVVCIGTGLCH